MRLIDADALSKVVNADINRCYQLGIGSVGPLSLFLDQINEQPIINPDDLRPYGRYRIDGHHIRFKCCDKVLSTVPNESDDYENLVSCPFCGAKMDGKENEDA